MRRIIDRDGHRCVWCGCELGADHLNASIDHALPRSRGGSHRLDNIMLACVPCNTTRHDRDLLNWMRDCESRGLDVQRHLVKQAHKRVLHSPKTRRVQPLAVAA